MAWAQTFRWGSWVAHDSQRPCPRRARAGRSFAVTVARAFDFFVSDPLHHYMEWGMLQGIKQRAEQPLAGDDPMLDDGAAV